MSVSHVLYVQGTQHRHSRPRLGKGTALVEGDYLLPEVGGLKTRGSSFGDAKSILKMFVERIEEAVGKAPEEKEDGDEANGVKRFFEGELGGFRALLV